MVEVGLESRSLSLFFFPSSHVLPFRSLLIAVNCLLHLDSYNHSSSRCTVVTINMYTKAIALAILAVAGVQAQSDYDYE